MVRFCFHSEVDFAACRSKQNTYKNCGFASFHNEVRVGSGSESEYLSQTALESL